MTTARNRNRLPQTPTTRWEDLLDRLTLRMLAVARGMTRSDESVWTSHSKKSASRYVIVRLGLQGSPGGSFTIRISDHPLDHSFHARNFNFEIILKAPEDLEKGDEMGEEELEFYLKSTQTRSAIRAAKRALGRWLTVARDRRNGKTRPGPYKRNCKWRG